MVAEQTVAAHLMRIKRVAARTRAKGNLATKEVVIVELADCGLILLLPMEFTV